MTAVIYAIAVFSNYAAKPEALSPEARNCAVFAGVQVGMNSSWMPWKVRRYACVCVTATLQVALAIVCSKQQSPVTIIQSAESGLRRTIVKSTAIEKALDELRERFPNSIVIGFEELVDPRPDEEPQVDLGPEGSSLSRVLGGVRSTDPKYRVRLIQGSLVRVYPIKRTADPVGLLDVRLHEFSMPQDSCLQSAIENIERYAPELSRLLARRKTAWYLARHEEVPGVAGDILGNCFPEFARGPVYRNITVRDSLNLLVKRSLEVSRKEVTPNSPLYQPYRPLSWKFRFRLDAEADTGLGGRPVFQTF